jgi:putative peptide zinc metalloprotease protein
MAIALVHVEALQQLIPVARLDGYFVVADLVGVPDLFGRIGPILGSLAPGRPLHPKVAELRPAARAVVALWVLTIGPVMAAMIGLLAWNAPSITTQVFDSMRRQWLVLEAAVPVGQWVTGTLAVLSLLLLPLPLLGMAWLFGGLLRRLLFAIVRAVRGTRPRPHRVGASKEIAMSGSDPTLTPPPAPPDGPDSVALSGAPPSSAMLTAADLDRPVLPTRHPVPKLGVLRRSVYAASGGHINPGPGAKERFQVELRDRVRTRFEGTRRIVVLSRKGGAGKTTTTLMLGHTFATHRGDRVVALDANPDAGSLAMRVPRETSSSATDLLADRAWVDRYSQIRSYTSQDPVSRLEVVASDDDPRISLALGNQDYRNLVDTLDRHYNLILVDTGTGILDDAIKGLLEEADQLVLVMPPAMDGGRVAAMTLDWLDQHGYQTLVRRSIAVVNGVRGVGSEPLELLENHFRARCSSVLRVPWDAALEAGAHTSLGDLRPATRQAYLELAGVVAESFPTSTRALFGDQS